MRLGDVLDAAGSRTFVGRDRELAAFDDAVGGRSSRRVFLVHGIGKSTLLGQFRAHALAAGRPAVLVDGREVDPSPDGVRAALARALPGRSTRFDDLRAPALLVDHYEQLTAADPWMRRELLPDLPADAVAVLAGRHAPDPAWRRLPGWRELGAVFRLESLSDAESREFLVRSGGRRDRGSAPRVTGRRPRPGVGAARGRREPGSRRGARGRARDLHPGVVDDLGPARRHGRGRRAGGLGLAGPPALRRPRSARTHPARPRP
jgi:hypothetical protein